MKSHIVLGVILGLALTTASYRAYAAQLVAKNESAIKTVPYLPVPAGAAVILNAGSTNARGYRIVVDEHANAGYVVAGSAAAHATVPTSLSSQFFADVKAAMPLSALPHAACMKSVSFGTSLFVWWQHERSPDLTCAADERGRRLAADAASIAQALQISNLTHGPVMRPLLPGEQHRPLPSPSGISNASPSPASASP